MSHSMRRRITSAAGAALCVLLAACVNTAPPATAPPVIADDVYTPLVPSVPSPPRWFTGGDGTSLLVYELELLNGFPVPVTVTGVDVLATGAERPIAGLSGSALTEATSLLAPTTPPTTTIPASAMGVVWMAIPVPGPGAIPASIQHRITVTVPPGLPVPGSITYTSRPTEVDRRPPLVVGPPLVGPGWIAAGSCCDGPHRRALQPVDGELSLAQRFAIDWNGSDVQGRLVVGDPDVNTSWVFYGAPVIAVAPGAVVQAVDRFPDQVPNQPKPVGLDEAEGNHVIVDLGGGHYASFDHLKAGSVAVRAGDRVCRGQKLGELGNSGSSSGPHLHFHIADAPTLAGDGLPYVIDEFTLSGKFPPLDQAEKFIDASQPVPIDTAVTGPRHDELPLGLDVVSFPGTVGCR
ncbi:M23 family metallopeptidase [Pseudonocardia alaniniphila]|uniref:M23 family metallopeptidase n=1 Tax=Pseudonocardia alaniniphila TaxID=75291 RepID=A0ABS9TQ50_9PSEU|nr:M23 family metallopeptidase [Pseudonocardia alaniniphila]MCH6170674.1 M23 family metallopeptidase [Pseudonocardia alaniniphila]